MSIKNSSNIEDKIEELENRLRPQIRYNINNKEIHSNLYDALKFTEIQAKIDALKWYLFKKRKI